MNRHAVAEIPPEAWRRFRPNAGNGFDQAGVKEESVWVKMNLI